MVSPDHKTLLILSSGFNGNNGPDGNSVPSASTQYVFVYDIGGERAREPVKQQVLLIPNTFAGIAFAPDRTAFYVSDGGGDTLYSFTLQGGQWAPNGAPIPLGHTLSDGTEATNTAGLDSALSTPSTRAHSTASSGKGSWAATGLTRPRTGEDMSTNREALLATVKIERPVLE
ncbi:MAG: hypothetical protein ACJ8H8_04240 [Geminicoccaceae bacterium]